MKKEATLIVVKNTHRGDDVIENVLNYVLYSMFADLNSILVNNLRTDDFYHMVEDFYKVQEPYKQFEKHRRLLHFILTTRVSKDMQRTLDEAAEDLLEYFTCKGHQVLIVPHHGSATKAEHYHWHAVVNVKSYITDKTLLDKFSTYKEICDYLNQNPYTHWSYKYHR